MTRFVNESPNRVGVIHLPRHENLHIVMKADQSPIKHPMRRPRQRNSIGNDIGTICLNRPDMRGIDLSPATTIDKLEAGDGASFVICL